MRLLIAAAVLVAIGATAVAAYGRSDRPAALKPPVIRETFTLLACPKHPVSTLDMEGCIEHRIVHRDRQIDKVARTIFGRLGDDAAKQDFIAAQTAWLAYRLADCTSVSDTYAGGTLAGLVAASCTADRSLQRLKDVRAFAALLRSP